MSKTFDTLYYNPSDAQNAPAIPNVNGTLYLINGELKTWTGRVEKVYSPIRKQSGVNESGEATTDLVEIGQMAIMTEKEAVEAVQSAAAAYDKGLVSFLVYLFTYCYEMFYRSWSVAQHFDEGQNQSSGEICGRNETSQE